VFLIRKRLDKKNPENNYGTEHTVVVSDPKSRTGDRDRQDLMKQLSTVKLMGEYGFRHET